MGIVPFAVWRPVPSHSGPMIAHQGLVLHVQVGDGSCYGEFANPANQASSTWWVSKTGLIEQYVDSDITAWTEAAGNPYWDSVETEGQPTEALTEAQVASVGALYAWGVQRYGWPLSLAETPTDRGLGWHGMGGAAWGGHYGCPGDLRKAQRPAILAHASTAPTPAPTQEKDMIASTPSGNGYWVLKPDGSVWSYGDAQYHGGANRGAPVRTNVPGMVDIPGPPAGLIPAGHVATGIAAYPLAVLDGQQGYWITTDFGGVYAFGIAAYHGGPNQAAGQ